MAREQQTLTETMEEMRRRAIKLEEQAKIEAEEKAKRDAARKAAKNAKK